MTTPPDVPFAVASEPRLSLEQYALLLDHLPEGVYLLQSGVFIYVNLALATMAGGRPEDIVGKPLLYMIAPEDHDIVASRYRKRSEGWEMPDTYEFSVLCIDRVTRIPIFMHTARIPAREGFISVGTIIPVIKRAALVETAADHQALTDLTSRPSGPDLTSRPSGPDVADVEADRLSIPVLQIHPRALIVPLVGRVNAARARILMDRVLAAIAEHRASEVILDITGVPVVDERVASYLVRTAAAVRLLGARLTLAGISPTIARTLITLGVDLRALDTTASLQDAWQTAAQRLG